MYLFYSDATSNIQILLWEYNENNKENSKENNNKANEQQQQQQLQLQYDIVTVPLYTLSINPYSLEIYKDSEIFIYNEDFDEGMTVKVKDFSVIKVDGNEVYIYILLFIYI